MKELQDNREIVIYTKIFTVPAETIIGLYKYECIREDSPFRNGPIKDIADLENITSKWVHWFNTERLLHKSGLIPPNEAEEQWRHTVTNRARLQN